jgi:hypothetical protein
VDLADADSLKERTRDFAHAQLVIDDKHFELANLARNLTGSRLHDAP